MDKIELWIIYFLGLDRNNIEESEKIDQIMRDFKQLDIYMCPHCYSFEELRQDEIYIDNECDYFLYPNCHKEAYLTEAIQEL